VGGFFETCDSSVPAGRTALTPFELESQLEVVARRLGVVVRFEVLEEGAMRGGLCKVNGETCIVVDRAASILEQIATLEGALAKLDLEGIFLPPLVRARIEARR
jgi:hypothetical protein